MITYGENPDYRPLLLPRPTPRIRLAGGHRVARPSGAFSIEDSLAELAQLAATAGMVVAGQTYQRISHPNPATLIGSGKLAEIIDLRTELGACAILFDEELNPRQQREIEKAVKNEDVKVLDRTALILDIFAKHAHTREGALQVELAQYEYRLPRLTRAWTHLARQAGGGAAASGTGGVGLRGPGETQLEVDRREIGRRIAHLRRELEEVRAHRQRYRQRRRGAAVSTISLVGYTNAGKSTLLNALTRLAGPEAGALACWRLTCCSRRWTRRRGACGCLAGARRCSPTPSASSKSCRRRWWPPFAPRWRRSRSPTCCYTL